MKIQAYTCERCDSRVVPVVRCASCRGDKREASRAYRAAHKRLGLCSDCSDPAIPGQLMCRRHQARATERSRVHHAEHRDVANAREQALRAEKAAQGICVDCSRKAVKGRAQCRAHLAWHREYQQARSRAG